MNSVLVEPLVLAPLKNEGNASSDKLVPVDLDLVGHVKVRVTALLGEMELSLAELFELKAGKVLSLEQLLDEPVVLQLNGKAIATAHLVAVGEHFGVQIVQVL